MKFKIKHIIPARQLDAEQNNVFPQFSYENFTLVKSPTENSILEIFGNFSLFSKVNILSHL